MPLSITLNYYRKLRQNRPGVGAIRGGKRKDLDSIYLRCGWEANYARVLNLQEKMWEYEPRTFEFPLKRGTRYYTPDFYLINDDQWHEVKGWWNSKSKTQLRRFKKYYPDEFAKLYIVTSDVWGNSKTARSIRRFLFVDLKIPKDHYINYNKLKKDFQSIIPGWEK